MRMSVAEILDRENFLDGAILRHGFTTYARDYTILVGYRPGAPSEMVHQYQFIGCVEVIYQLILPPTVWTNSLSDAHTQWPLKGDDASPPGFIWGVGAPSAYPGLTYFLNGPHAMQWTERLGYTMHEVTIETQIFHLRLVFADLRYECTESLATARAFEQPLPQ